MAGESEAHLSFLEGRGAGAFVVHKTPRVFTLTPALSLRGRGRALHAGSCFRACPFAETWPAWLPLPAGEGWGEGEEPRTRRTVARNCNARGGAALRREVPEWNGFPRLETPFQTTGTMPSALDVLTQAKDSHPQTPDLRPQPADARPQCRETLSYALDARSQALGMHLHGPDVSARTSDAHPQASEALPEGLGTCPQALEAYPQAAEALSHAPGVLVQALEGRPARLVTGMGGRKTPSQTSAARR